MGTIDTIVTSMIRKEENLLKEIRQLRRIVVNKNKEIAELKVEVALQKEMAMEAMRILESLAREPPTSG